ncbi:hypothetical protein [Thermosulfurimonas sp. F29]|uniref:hypothetical protein n=1 Tax=Thermosulfurimonas sp. F29 TaxID=2867247 RepID=UPI001C835AA7|nr:hypothetical protein [Thermosulfurimonas sp. F29]MBX6423352.1 hypothetical protein [Thermosulfurimonas sp. F29]
MRKRIWFPFSESVKTRAVLAAAVGLLVLGSGVGLCGSTTEISPLFLSHAANHDLKAAREKTVENIALLTVRLRAMALENINLALTILRHVQKDSADLSSIFRTTRTEPPQRNPAYATD